jgi:hypothetical protein
MPAPAREPNGKRLLSKGEGNEKVDCFLLSFRDAFQVIIVLVVSLKQT